MARPSRFITLIAPLAVLAGAVVADGQVAWRALLDTIAPPPVDRGLVFDESHAPDSRDTVIRRSVRVAAAAPDRVGPSGAAYVPGRVIVKFRDAASPSARLTALRAVAGSRGLSRPSYADFDLLSLDAGEDAESVASALRARPDVEYAQPAYRVHVDFVPNDPLYRELQWNLPLIDMEAAWDIQRAAGSSMTVAVLDTGIAYTDVTMRFHAQAFAIDAAGDLEPPGGPGLQYPSLGDLTLSFVAAPQLGSSSRFVAPIDFIWNDNLPIDLDGHGTHVSGTVGQLTNDGAGTAGVAFGVKLMPVKVIDGNWDDIFGSPNQGTDDLVARGIRYAADNGANVINMSIGRTGPSNCGTNPNQSGCAPAVESAIRYAVSKGAFVTIAGGNDFERGNPTEVIADLASRVEGCVAVAAVDPSKGRSYFSSTGSWIELAAPGGSNRGFGREGFVFQQTYDFNFTDTFLQPPARFTAPRFDVLAYIGYIGTSQAAPHVSGVAAMLMQQGITKPAAVEAALERFATDLGASGRDDTFGYGLIAARNTLYGLGLAK